MQRSLILAAAAAATLFTATAANAGGHVNWSVGINLPPVATVVSSPGYYPAPAYYGAPAYYPEPVYYSAPSYYPAPVVYAPRVYAPWPRVGYPAPRYGGSWRGHDQWHHDGRADWRR